MTDFTSAFWPWFIFISVVLSIAAVFGLVFWMSLGKRAPGEKAATMGHVWDENLEELNNPLPRWWLNLFYITLVFGVVYLVLYPGSGLYQGALNWTQLGQYQVEVKAADEKFGPLYEKYHATDIKALAADSEALKIGQRLFVTYCTGCHGSDAGGGPGYPNLRDGDWLYGGEPAMIEASIRAGRQGVMPGWAAALGGQEGVLNVAEYVLSLSGRRVNEEAARAGKEKFGQICAACHGADGRGNQALGAPNLTDNIWLYGGSQATVMASIATGRQGKMPAHGEFLGDAKVHLLAAYIYSLSQEDRAK